MQPEIILATVFGLIYTCYLFLIEHRHRMSELLTRTEKERRKNKMRDMVLDRKFYFSLHLLVTYI